MKNRIGCLYCKSKNLCKILRVNEIYSLFLCKNCRIIFTFPQSRENLLGDKNGQLYNSLEEKESRIANFRIEYKKAVRHILSLKRFKKQGKLLDVGCSYGITLKAAKDLGFSAYGIEPTSHAVEYAVKELKQEVLKGKLESNTLRNVKFDIITLYDVLEHLPDLDKNLRIIYRLLKKDGVLVIQSPNADSYAMTFLRANWNWLLVPYHLWHFTSKSISNVLEKNHFSIITTETQDDVYDFASNITTKYFPRTNDSISRKVKRKLFYLSAYSFISISSIIWNLFKKGGQIIVYAKKS